MHKTTMLAVLLGLATLAGCAHMPSSSTANNLQQTLDWSGVYTGTLPCGNCAGIKTALTLNTNNTYVLSSQFLNSTYPNVEPVEDIYEGSFRWVKGDRISLGDAGQIEIGHGEAHILDQNGQRIKGAMANSFRLIKQS